MTFITVTKQYGIAYFASYPGLWAHGSCPVYFSPHLYHSAFAKSKRPTDYRALHNFGILTYINRPCGSIKRYVLKFCAFFNKYIVWRNGVYTCGDIL